MSKLSILSIAAIIAYFLFTIDSPKDMPEHQLAIYGQDEYGPLDGNIGGRCFEEKCLTIYVAPWCPQCKRAQPMILKLTKELRAEGVNVSVVVGSDSLKAVKDYAKNYPFPVLLDADKSFYNKTKQNGVPFFISSNQKGKIIQSQAGFYNQVSEMRKRLEL